MLLTQQRRRVDRVTPQDASLVLDFRRRLYRMNGQASPLSTVFTLSRSTPALGIDDEGNLTSFAANVPRISRLPSGKGGGLVLEGPATNICLQNSELATTPWSTSSMTVTNSADIGPDGTMSASTCVDTAAAGSTAGTVNQGMNVGTTTSWWTASAFIKMTLGTQFSFYLGITNGSTAVGGAVEVDAAVGAIISNPSSLPVTLEAAPGGYVRVALSVLYNLTGSGEAVMQFSRINNAASSISFSVAHCQLEAGQTASSPIATTTATASRAGDFAQITPLSGGWFNAASGTFVIDADLNGGATSDQMSIASLENTGGDNILLQCAAEQLKYTATVSSTGQASAIANGAVLPRRVRVACGYGTGNYHMAVGGLIKEYGAAPFAGVTPFINPILQAATGMPGGVPAGMSTILLGGLGATTLFNGVICQFVYFPRILSAADMTALVL